MIAPSDSEANTGLNVRELTWTALLGRWVEFARAAMALPDDDAGRRLRESVADIIMLQAVWFALRDLGQLDAAQKAVGLDRAEVLIDRHAGLLQQRWGNEPLPRLLTELIDDAHSALRIAAAGMS
ncbi:MAG: hypothetical protein IT440_14580 [Phycisphaeraceae bacterium]|nr:hypothetical protein [Phycisphaeraceae bacterium]